MLPSKAKFFAKCLAGIFLVICIGTLLSFSAYLFNAWGGDPESIQHTETIIPYLALFLALMISGHFMKEPAGASRWSFPITMAVFFVAAWFCYRCYLIARWDFALWWHEGLLRLTLMECFIWALTLPACLAGEVLGRWLAGKSVRLRRMGFIVASVATLGALISTQVASGISRRAEEGPYGTEIQIARGVTYRCESPTPDGTTVRLTSYDFSENPGIRVRVYDCTVDTPAPLDDNNAIYKSLSLEALAAKLQGRESAGQLLFTVCNGGFFGDHGLHVADHIAPLVVDGNAWYDVDLIRPRDQECLFGVTNEARRKAGEPRFQLLENTPWEKLGARFQTVMGGVRPLRVAGESRTLAPGAGNTRLKCSRTSLGWSADGNHLYLLSVHDPDTELGSNMQKKFGWEQTGGWDVLEVQQFWERMQVPYAVLFDGGNSTQLASRDKAGGMMFLDSGLPVGIQLGYWNKHPLRAFLPILPAALQHHGVLNYLYVEGPP